MNPVIMPLDTRRSGYRRAQQFIEKLTGRTDFIINGDTLRLEQALTPDTNSYVFNLEKEGDSRPLASHLNRNDIFILSYLMVGICKYDPVNQLFGNYPIFTSPDPNYFVGALAANGGPEWQALETIYNGSLTVKTATLDRLQNFATSNFRFVPERGYIKQAGSQINDEFPQYGPNDEARGYYPINPNIVLSGQEENQVQLRLGQGDTGNIAGAIDDQGAAVDTRNAVVILAHGYTIKNAAQAAGRWNSEISAI